MSNYQTVKLSSHINSFFDKAVVGEKTFSSMEYQFPVDTSFNGGDLIPVYHFEFLPNSIFEVEVDFVLRMETLKHPPFGDLILTIDAYMCYNYQVNVDFPAIFGENYAGAGIAESVELAPLFAITDSSPSTIKIKPGSVADYLFMPTQQNANLELLADSNDLIVRHYCEVRNTFYRDENLQAQLQYSKLNVYQGYLLDLGSLVPLGVKQLNLNGEYEVVPTSGGYADGSINKALYGEGGNPTITADSPLYIPARKSSFCANSRPPKAPRFHDYFSSCLPFAQKGEAVLVNFQGGSSVPVNFTSNNLPVTFDIGGPMWRSSGGVFRFNYNSQGVTPDNSQWYLSTRLDSNNGLIGSVQRSRVQVPNNNVDPGEVNGMNLLGSVDPTKISANVNLANSSNIGVSINDLRLSAAMQQLYEALARGGSRYDEYLRVQFNLSINDRLGTRPYFIGRITRRLDFFQTAQTVPTENSPQSSLTAFGYTATSGRFPRFRTYANGYCLFMMTVRQINRYPALYPKDKLRRRMADYYQPQLANIGEQPVYSYEINAFAPLVNANGDRNVFGYQEPFHEYRIQPAQATGLMRKGTAGNMANWTVQDEFDPSLLSIGDKWIESNAEEIINNLIVVPSSYDDDGNALTHQFFGEFLFKIRKVIPMPTFSTPGMDII